MIEVALSEDRLKNIDSDDLSYLAVAYALDRTEIGTDRVRVRTVEILECLRQTEIYLNERSKYLDPV